MNYPDGIENHYWITAKNHIIYDAIIKNGLTNLKLLEVGCGRGGVITFLAGKKLNVFGLELAKITFHSMITIA